MLRWFATILLLLHATPVDVHFRMWFSWMMMMMMVQSLLNQMMLSYLINGNPTVIISLHVTFCCYLLECKMVSNYILFINETAPCVGISQRSTILQGWKIPLLLRYMYIWRLPLSILISLYWSTELIPKLLRWPTLTWSVLDLKNIWNHLL